MPGLLSALWGGSSEGCVAASQLLLVGEGKVEQNCLRGAELLPPGTRDLGVTRQRLITCGWVALLGSE